MPVLKNINPLGQVDLPLVGRQGDPIGVTGSGCLEPGEEFTVTDEEAQLLLEQTTNYEAVDGAAKKLLPQPDAEHVEDGPELLELPTGTDVTPSTPAPVEDKS